MIGDTPQVLRVAVPRFPNISVSPDSYDFGNVSVGNTSTASTFTISNADTETALVISTITLAGVNPTEFSIQNETCTAQFISPSGDCICQVTFSPSTASVKSAILRIQSNDPDTPTKDISLTGTGTAQPTYSISGTVTLNSSGLSNVIMTLSGTASKTTTTDSSGIYSLTGLNNGTYTVTPSLSGYTFTPPNRSVTINGADATGQDFTASAETTCTSWSDVISEYGKYVSGTSTWFEVINIYTQYVTNPC